MFRSTLIAALALCCSTVTGAAAEFSGSANRIVDGDTFWVCDASACHKIRICGINAPEKGQPGYQESTEALKKLSAGRSVRCIQVGNGTPCDGRSKPTSHDRIVAQCFTDDTDIASVLVGQGFACDWVKFSGGAYSRAGKGNRCNGTDDAVRGKSAGQIKRDDGGRRFNLEVCMNGGDGCNYTILTDEERTEAIRREEGQASSGIRWGAVSAGPCAHSTQTASDGSRCGGMGTGAPVCTCETKGTRGGSITVRCKSGTKSDTCEENERPGGNCKGAINARCVRWY